MPPHDETERRKQAIAAKQTDYTRWADPRNLEAAWEARAALVARYVPAGSTVLDIGCGAMALERHLPAGSRYLPCDLVARDARTRVCDLNRGELPRGDLAPGVVVTLLGVLEYLYDARALLAELAGRGVHLLLTYCCAEDTVHLDRGALGWVNALRRDEVTALLTAAGFRVDRIDRVDGLQHVWSLRPAGVTQPTDADTRTAPQRPAPRVLVLSYANVGNFGDRLGWHLVHQVLPPDATVTHAFHDPWAPPEGAFDLLVLGIGNSLFQPMFAHDGLLALMDRIPHRIGIFGTQYRQAIDRARMKALMQRLGHWWARYAEDIQWCGEHAQRTTHLGDWLIDACPMARPVDARTLQVGDEMWNNLPLDRTIQQIQRFARVRSGRLHPLLCALTSADAVAYDEQPHPETGQPSGKFRSMLLDVFGREMPPAAFWPVERERVAAYKRKVRAGIDALRADIAARLA